VKAKRDYYRIQLGMHIWQFFLSEGHHQRSAQVLKSTSKDQRRVLLKREKAERFWGCGNWLFRLFLVHSEKRKGLWYKFKGHRGGWMISQRVWGVDKVGCSLVAWIMAMDHTVQPLFSNGERE
jgi:hypothetical protein